MSALNVRAWETKLREFGTGLTLPSWTSRDPDMLASSSSSNSCSAVVSRMNSSTRLWLLFLGVAISIDLFAAMAQASPAQDHMPANLISEFCIELNTPTTNRGSITDGSKAHSVGHTRNRNASFVTHNAADTISQWHHVLVGWSGVTNSSQSSGWHTLCHYQRQDVYGPSTKGRETQKRRNTLMIATIICLWISRWRILFDKQISLTLGIR